MGKYMRRPKMAKETTDTVKAQDAQDTDEELVKEATSTVGRTPHEVMVVIRETAKMLQSVKLARIEELAIGTYFVPFEGQLGIEGLIEGAAELMNRYVKAGWQPWQMANPYPGKYSFNLGGVQTGVLDGQWITIIWAKPSEELQ